MSKTKKNRKRRQNIKIKSVEDLVEYLKRSSKKEENLIQHITDLEFYIQTLEEDFFEDSEEDDINKFVKRPIDNDDYDAPEDVMSLFTIDQVLAELEEPKKNKKKKKKGKKKK
tara:strand:+ start:2894 stop:3232 length:339 start_codon:yes stop_codon:yes gene_type:complete